MNEPLPYAVALMAGSVGEAGEVEKGIWNAKATKE